MSLEARIEELTKAIERNTEIMLAINKGDYRLQNVVTAPLDEIKLGGYAAAVVAEKELKRPKDAATASKPEEPASGTLQNSDSPVEQSKITYDDVKKATLALAQHRGRDAVLQLLDTFGVSKAQGLKEDQWESYMASVEAGLK